MLIELIDSEVNDMTNEYYYAVMSEDDEVYDGFETKEEAIEQAIDYGYDKVGYIKETIDDDGDLYDFEILDIVWNSEENNHRVVAEQRYDDSGIATDDCFYDDIIVVDSNRNGDLEFANGSGHKWKNCSMYVYRAEECYSDYLDSIYDDDAEYEQDDALNYVAYCLEKEYGGNWVVDTIRGSSQRECVIVIYDANTHKNIDYFECDYFGMGKSYNIYVDGNYEVTVWVNSLDEDNTLDIIADACGCDEDEIYIKEL